MHESFSKEYCCSNKHIMCYHYLWKDVLDVLSTDVRHFEVHDPHFETHILHFPYCQTSGQDTNLCPWFYKDSPIYIACNTHSTVKNFTHPTRKHRICIHLPSFKYTVIRKSLRDFRTRLHDNQDRHGRKEHIEHLQGRTETWSVSLSVDMLLSALSVLVVAQSSSEIPEGLMNNPVQLGQGQPIANHDFVHFINFPSIISNSLPIIFPVSHFTSCYMCTYCSAIQQL